jgi:hypothetical protein
MTGRITAVLATAAIAIAGCSGGSSGPAMQEVRGHVLGGTQAAATVGSALGGAGGICGGGSSARR